MSWLWELWEETCPSAKMELSRDMEDLALGVAVVEASGAALGYCAGTLFDFLLAVWKRLYP